MTIVKPFAAGAVSTIQSMQRLTSTRAALDDLQRQLTTERRSETFAGLGLDRRISLAARGHLAKLEAFREAITRAEPRAKIIEQSLQTLSKLAADTRSDLLTGVYGPNNPARLPMRDIAEGRFKAAIDALNAHLDGRFLFSGRASDRPPIASFDAIMNGADGRLGLRAFVDERLVAHDTTGPDARGRLGVAQMATPLPTATIAITQPPPAQPFGFAVPPTQTLPSWLTYAIEADGSGASLTVGAQPVEGERVRIVLRDRLAGPGEYEIVLTARASGSGPLGPNEFAVGDTEVETAAAFASALDEAVGRLAREQLAPAVRLDTAFAFFDDDQPLGRPMPPPPATATTLVPGAVDDQVAWYRGEAGPGGSAGARATAPVRVGDEEVIGLGARADEAAFRSVLASLGALATMSFEATSGGNDAHLRTADRLADRLSDGGPGSLQATSREFGLARVAMQDAAERHKWTNTFLLDTLDDVEGVNREEIAAKILAAQTRLEASYRTTAMLSRLSLVNFL